MNYGNAYVWERWEAVRRSEGRLCDMRTVGSGGGVEDSMIHEACNGYHPCNVICNCMYRYDLARFRGGMRSCSNYTEMTSDNFM